MSAGRESLTWVLAALLGAIAGAVVASAQLRHVRAELAQRPAVIVVDYAGIVSRASTAEMGEVAVRIGRHVRDLGERGFLVVDGQAVLASPRAVPVLEEVP